MFPRVVHVRHHALHVPQRVTPLSVTQRLVAHLELLQHNRSRLRRLDAQEELVHLQDPSLDAVEELLLDLTQTQRVERLDLRGGRLGELASLGRLPRDGFLSMVLDVDDFGSVFGRGVGRDRSEMRGFRVRPAPPLALRTRLVSSSAS